MSDENGEPELNIISVIEYLSNKNGSARYAEVFNHFRNKINDSNDGNFVIILKSNSKFKPLK
jgi:hypothetical protein